jgi:ssRNA-specific RNase YbeY (16S rRNA maturation enzyme)
MSITGEEEKEAIEYIKEFKNEVFEGVGNKSIMAKNIDILLNLLDKQQNEIKEKTTILLAGAKKVKQLEKEIEERDKYNITTLPFEELKEMIEQNKNISIFGKEYISKDKVKETIEHYNNELEHIKNGEEFENEKPMYYWGKVALEDLLEEN